MIPASTEQEIRTRKPAPRLSRRCLIIAAVVMLPILFCGWFAITWDFAVERHQKHYRQIAAQFSAAKPAEWAAVADACREIWERGQQLGYNKVNRMPLPPVLDRLEPVNWDLREDELTLSWTGGFDDAGVFLFYKEGILSWQAWISEMHLDQQEKQVWPPTTSTEAK